MQTVHVNSRERGFTLTEILVAVATFAIIFVATLMIYDRANQDFKGGMERSEMQQTVRVAYEKLVADVRLAGFDYDRDGFPTGAGGAAWQKSKVYGVGNIVSPLIANGFTYVVTQGGTSGASEPSWNTTPGGITNDGTVKWRTDPGINQYQQPDEQIEYAHERALALRANFDFETDSATGNGRETLLQSPQFPVVTTGNDEIVTYALRSNLTESGVNPDTISFYADIPDRRSHPGGRAENPVQIDDVDLCTSGTCTKPPYTLYRFSLDAGGAVVEAPVATNIREVKFTYYNDTVGTATPLVFTPAVANTAGSSGGGQYNPNNPAIGSEARSRRSEIRSIRVSLIGMNSSKDTRYVNPSETVGPGKNYRTFTLESLVVPRNLGKMGVRELQDAPPGEPALVSLCNGWCGGVKLTWQAPPLSGETGDVDQYVVIYDTVKPPVRFQKQVGPVTSAFIDDLDPTQRYFFTVAAVNSFGQTMAKDGAGNIEHLPTGALGMQVRNATTPKAPTNLLASGGDVAGSPAIQQNKITLSWNNPADNITGENTASCVLMAGGTSSETAVFVPGELKQYELLRSKDPDFDPDDPDEFEVVSTIAPNTLTVGPSASTLEDLTAVACVNYYYRVRVVERCNPPTAANNVNPADPVSEFFPEEGDPAILGRAEASAPPSTPAALIHPLPPVVQSSCGVECTILLQWPKVTTDTTTRLITVEDYVITRRQMKGNTVVAEEEIPVTDSTPNSGQNVTFGASDTPYYVDSGPHLPSIDTVDGTPYQYVYTVRAIFPCDPILESGETAELKFPCPYSGGATNVTASGMVEGTGLSLSSAWQTDASGASELLVTGGAGLVSVQVLLASMSSDDVINLGTDPAAPFSFPISGTDPGEFYRAYIIVRDTNGCQDIVVRYIEEGTPSGCCLAAQADDPLVVQYSQFTSLIDVFLKNACDNDLDVQANGINIVWNPVGTPAGTKLVSIDWAGESGGTVTQTVNNTTGTLTLSLPAGARDPIRAGETLRVQLHFNNILTTPSSPLTSFCVSYQRNGIDIANQNCRIVPEPVTANSCN